MDKRNSQTQKKTPYIPALKYGGLRRYFTKFKLIMHSAYHNIVTNDTYAYY